MGMRHPDRPCMKNAREKGPKFGCGPDMRSPEQIASDPYDTGVHSPMPTSTSPSGGEVAELNAKISQLEAGLTELKGVVRTLQEQSKNSMPPVAPTANTGGGIAGLDAKHITFLINHHSFVCEKKNNRWVNEFFQAGGRCN